MAKGNPFRMFKLLFQVCLMVLRKERKTETACQALSQIVEGKSSARQYCVFFRNLPPPEVKTKLKKIIEAALGCQVEILSWKEAERIAFQDLVPAGANGCFANMPQCSIIVSVIYREIYS